MAMVLDVVRITGPLITGAGGMAIVGRAVGTCISDAT